MPSLESQIAELVGKANSLINVFNSKKKELDDGVAAVVKSVGMNRRDYFVDASVGDDKAAGSTAAPIKTIAEVFRRTPFGSQVSIRLRQAQTHTIEGVQDWRFRQIYISPWSSGARPEIAFARIANTNDDSSACATIDGSQVFFSGTNLRTLRQEADSRPLSDLTSCFRYGNSSGRLHFESSDIEINDVNLLTLRWMDMADLSLAYVSVTAPGPARLVRGTGPLRLTVGSVTLAPGLVWDKPAAGQRGLLGSVVRDAAGNPRNVLANFVL